MLYVTLSVTTHALVSVEFLLDPESRNIVLGCTRSASIHLFICTTGSVSSQRFFFPWKSKCLLWNFLSIFEFSSVKNVFLPWKYPKNCPWNTRSVRENFFQITYVKMGTCVREKYNLLFPWNLAKFTFFCTREKKFSSVKIIKISLFSSREKENPSVKKSKHASVKTFSCKWKLLHVP